MSRETPDQTAARIAAEVKAYRDTEQVRIEADRIDAAHPLDRAAAGVVGKGITGSFPQQD